MSRGFLTVIGAMAGFYAGGILGHVVGSALYDSVEDGGLTAIGSILGLPVGCAIAWIAAGRRRDRR